MIHWRDSGQLHSIMGVRDFEALISQAWVGASWEGFVIEQALASLDAKGKSYDAYYFRTSDGYEIDLLINMAGKLNAIEIKLTSNPSRADIERLNKCADIVGASGRILVSKTSRTVKSRNAISTNLDGLLKTLT